MKEYVLWAGNHEIGVYNSLAEAQAAEYSLWQADSDHYWTVREEGSEIVLEDLEKDGPIAN